MNQAEAIEAIIGIVVLGFGLAHYFGWPNVAIGTGVIFLMGALIPAWRRNRDSKRTD